MLIFLIVKQYHIADGMNWIIEFSNLPLHTRDHRLRSLRIPAQAERLFRFNVNIYSQQGVTVQNQKEYKQ